MLLQSKKVGVHMKKNKKVINSVKNFKFEIEYVLPNPTQRQQ